MTPSYHNDGSVCPPHQILNVQHTVMRTTTSGSVHGANQAVSLDQALQGDHHQRRLSAQA